MNWPVARWISALDAAQLIVGSRGELHLVDGTEQSVHRASAYARPKRVKRLHYLTLGES